MFPKKLMRIIRINEKVEDNISQIKTEHKTSLHSKQLSHDPEMSNRAKVAESTVNNSKILTPK